MKKCPYCAEEIQDEAIKCKHCGEMLNNKVKVGIPKCPTCSSTEVEKISTGDRAMTMFFWGSPKNLFCTFKCIKCGHKW